MAPVKKKAATSSTFQAKLAGKRAAYEADMADVRRQEQEIAARDGGAGIRTSDLPTSDHQVTAEP